LQTTSLLGQVFSSQSANGSSQQEFSAAAEATSVSQAVPVSLLAAPPGGRFENVVLAPGAANYPPQVQREFRAAWITTVWNIDWPSRVNLSAGEQQREAIAILDRAQRLNLNALVFQVAR
jgi:uncharacterized lipoprotein YddW (UPF0748 family)